MQLSEEIAFQAKDKASAKIQGSKCLRSSEEAREAGQEWVRTRI